MDIIDLLGGFRENAWVLELAEIRFSKGDLPGALKIAAKLKEHIEIHGELRSVVMLLPRTDDLISRILYGRYDERAASAVRPDVSSAPRLTLLCHLRSGAFRRKLSSIERSRRLWMT